METIGFVGVGKIGLPISENLIKSGYRVVGFRRSSLADFEKIGGVPAKSAADVGAQADIVFSCLPSTEALDDAMQGPNGLIKSARPGQIVVELGSHPVPDKKRQIAPLKEKGISFIDGEVSGTPGMVVARKGVIYLAGDAEACKRAERVVAGFADSCIYFGAFGAAICWDQWFPESARAMALMGAEALFYPTAIGSEPPPAPPIDSRDHWRRTMQGHAAANMVPLVASNRIGVEKGQAGEMTFYGSSFIADPTGGIVAELGRTDEGIAVATFDLDEIAQARTSWGLFRDRRPELYRVIGSHDGR